MEKIIIKNPNNTRYCVKRNRNSLKGFIAFIILISCFLAFSSSIGPSGIRAQEQDNIIDGIISDTEYDLYTIFSDGDYKLYWEKNGSEIFFGMIGKTTGWVSLGINPSLMMLDADMIFGWVNSNGTVEVIDAYATGPMGPHPPDNELGGTSDILEFNGTEVDGVTTIEFKRLLATSDSYDQPLPSTEDVKILWALGSSDSFDAPHVKKGSALWNIEGATGFNADLASPFVLGTFLIGGLSGFLIFVDTKGRRNQKNARGDGIVEENQNNDGGNK